MKKAKIMLTAIAVITVVGGALAFKAQKFSSLVYCTKPNYQAGDFCDVKKTQITFVNDLAATIGYITTVDSECPSEVECTATGRSVDTPL